jgi:hypothetical protein
MPKKDPRIYKPRTFNFKNQIWRQKKSDAIMRFHKEGDVDGDEDIDTYYEYS